MKKPASNTIVTVPDARLREPTEKVGSFDIDLATQIENMTKALREEGGVGIAANQLGYQNRVLIAEFNDPDGEDFIPYQVFVNPEVINYSLEHNCVDEGCLSVPPIELPVDRAVKIKVKAQNERGQRVKITAKGLLARILQHEIDHLNGILFTDRVRDQYLKDHPELKKIKIVFVGSDEFAAPILKGLLLLGLNIPLVITESAKPAGRHHFTCKTVVSQIAHDFKKPLIETNNIQENIDDIKKANPDLIILTDFGQLVPKEILAIPKLGAFNLHPSLLPKYRGATPIQTAILNGDKTTGATLMEMSPEFDKGPVLAQIQLEIYDEETAEELEKRLSVAGLKLLHKVLPQIVGGTIPGKPQNEKEATKTHKFTKEDGLINWHKKPAEIHNQIRAFYPWPGSYTILGNKRLIILSAHLENDCLKIDVVKPEGKQPMLFEDFLRGYHGPKPEWLN